MARGLPNRTVTVLKGRMNFALTGWTSVVAEDPDGDDRDAALPRQPRDPGPALVHELVESPGALWVQTQQVAAGQDLSGGLQCPFGLLARRDGSGSVRPQLKNQAVRQLSKYSALARKVTFAPDDQRKEKRITKGLVVGRQHGRAALGHVLSPFDLHLPEQIKNG